MSNPDPVAREARKAPRHSAGKEPSPKSVKKAQARLQRRWPRRALIATNILAALCIVAMASAYAYVKLKIGSLATLPSPSATPPGDLVGGESAGNASTDGLHPENILLIGNQTRQGLTPQEQQQFGSSVILSGSLADIMMVLHLDPATDTASILSIPRDLFAPMPAGSPVGSFQKMDAALNDGKLGPNNLMKAVQDDLGIPINHFVELNFNGFINTVNALGGIKVDFPEPVWDPESLLYVPNPGCIALDGFRALELVRARHLRYEPKGEHVPRYEWPQEAQSDLARIARTHTFLKIVADTAKAKGLTNPVTANSFLDAVIGQMTVDAPLKNELLTLVLHYRHVNVGNIKETTLPATGVANYYYGGYGMGDVLFPVQPADN
ncbi:MAG TPA: LCP family protein, partial [Acidimicrobiales bacterium]|nr:LCP family protein [Acidimicrobiales bacterium]